MRRIFTTLSHKWPEYLLEILVITIGILGAFALNNWNEQIKNAQSKALMITNLTKEFENNLSQLQYILKNDKRSSDAAFALLTMVHDGISLTDEKMDSVINDLSSTYSYDPTNGALRTAITSGHLHLLENEDLKEYLFSWEDMVLDAREDEHRFINHFLEDFDSFSDRARSSNWNHVYLPQIPKSKFKSDYEALMQDPAFENFLAEHVVYLSDATEELENLNKSILQVLELLSRE